MNTTLLKIQNLNKAFGNKKVLNNINFTVQQGHIIGLIGANGAGKTTIMKAILGILPFDGKITINDKAVSIRQHQPLQSVGALIEYPGLYPYLTGREQLRLFSTGKDREQKVNNIISKLRMDHFADQKTKGYSLGMKQKLGVGLALLNNPQFVILDEPMNGLDPKATKDLRDLIVQEKQNGVTFLISSHILSELQRIADDVIVINHGEIVTSTTMDNLLAANKKFYLIETDNNEMASDLLLRNNYQVENKTALEIPITDKFSINDLLQLLLSNNITINDIKQQDGDLEESLLKVLDSEGK
ncbi:ATP-binding cassette domain-containing protein [Companilactobacillus kimchii]|uniref:ABC transporter ATPase n=2 Tax=Companilactobacillus kimchii TaxID=2801452 RepID=A0ABR5NSE2_9LACO|nr:ATP-binding cassette domain-containing protein [Companilactobacillus kimchii]KAE9562296.1 ABC transporter ATP-binding protein [Companilactobacillus kimchii]KRK51075.1 ABC transporter ATPase [Companilactobacillus kimchii DSM 13961 = JCM 10707]OWF34445.1 Zinc import ATP-binding protein ZnuC [Companilactobacillus kimchii]GEO46369.1 ABC transporter ATP-binding protein [Companilactobacillus paralimentarius]